ncbi:MAG: beta-lactamase family protein [Dehalococcoidia bacterium]|nr:beta-lactamase family protein [Dehalococcoidia bacterium]
MPTIAGMSAERLGRIDSYLDERYLQTERFAGTLTLVWRKGEVAHCSAQGLMDAERAKPMTEDTIFRIYSMSKPITSVALMMLYEEGAFQLDDPVHKFIPSWERLGVWVAGAWPNFVTKAPERSMTMRDLLSHQSGLTYGFHVRNSIDAAYRELGVMERGGPTVLGPAREARPDAEDETLAKSIETLARLPLQFTPGTAWNYSISTDVCGYLVEVISGKPFDVYLRERVFEPLGMTDSSFSVPGEKVDRFAACYALSPGGKRVLQDDPQTSIYRKPPKLFSGGGGLVSTAADYLRFCRMLLNGGALDGVRLLSRKTIELMTMNHLAGGKDLAALAPPGQFSEGATSGTGFGLGFSVLMDQRLAQISGSPGQYAWGGAASTAFWIDPREQMIVIFMTQLLPSSTYPIRRELQALVNSAIVD